LTLLRVVIDSAFIFCRINLKRAVEMFKNKNLLFLISVAIIIRLPFFLFHGEPAGDEFGYFEEALGFIRSWQDGWSISPVYQSKLFFIILQAPVVGLLYSITGNVPLSVSVFPFLCSVLFVAFFYYFAEKLYGKDTAFWAGFICALMPFTVFYSSSMLTHLFFIYFFILGGFFLYRYLETRRMVFLLIGCVLLALLFKIRVEGYGVYLIAAYIIIDQYRKNKEEVEKNRRNFAKVVGIIIICPLTVYFVFWVVAASFLDSAGQATSVSNVLIGKALGNLSKKIYALYNVEFPGGFLKSNKFDYLIHNFYLVPYVVIHLGYEVLKTVFILPSRVIPPLFFIFLGLSYLGDSEGHHSTCQIEKFFLLSLLTVLIYPLIYFLSHSRYVYLVVPVAILFMSKGINKLEILLNERSLWKRKFITPRSLIALLIFCYLSAGYYYLEVGSLLKDKPPSILSARQKSGDVSIDKLITWVNKEFAGKNIPVMGMRDWMIYLENKENLDFPPKVKYVDGQWKTMPISFNETMDLLKGRQEALLVIFKSSVFDGQSLRERKRDYFKESLEKNLGFHDEGLELMRDPTESEPTHYFQEFKGLMNGTTVVPGLSLIKTFEVSETEDTINVFLYQRY